MHNGECEIKTCELCGSLFVRAAHPQEWVAALGLFIQIAKETDCPACKAHPPVEEEILVVSRSYRVVGIKLT